jgi:hypothetical protein
MPDGAHVKMSKTYHRQPLYGGESNGFVVYCLPAETVKQ